MTCRPFLVSLSAFNFCPRPLFPLFVPFFPAARAGPRGSGLLCGRDFLKNVMIMQGLVPPRCHVAHPCAAKRQEACLYLFVY